MANSHSIYEALRRNASDLLSVPHVLGVDVGPKIVGGRETDELAIRVKVAVKLPKEELPQKYVLPASIEGYPVDLVEVRSGFANTVLRAATYEQLSRPSSLEPTDPSDILSPSETPDQFRSFTRLLLKGWLTVTVLTSIVAVLFILTAVWGFVTRNIAFAAVAGSVTIVDLIAMGILRPWVRYQDALRDERVIQMSTGVLHTQLEELRDSKLNAKQRNELRAKYLKSWLQAVARKRDLSGE